MMRPCGECVKLVNEAIGCRHWQPGRLPRYAVPAREAAPQTPAQRTALWRQRQKRRAAGEIIEVRKGPAPLSPQERERRAIASADRTRARHDAYNIRRRALRQLEREEKAQPLRCEQERAQRFGDLLEVEQRSAAAIAELRRQMLL